jgi:hypothetical protein
VRADETLEFWREMSYALGGDPYGTRTVEGAKEAYAVGMIEVDELESRLDVLLKEEDSARI